MAYENEYFTKKSLKLFKEKDYHRNPQGFYTNVLEKSRDWDVKQHHLKNIMDALSEKFSDDESFLEKTGIFMNALIQNSFDMS